MSQKKPKGGKNVEAPREEISEYYFSFELIKHYPHVRSFIIKEPLKKSLGDTFSELLGSSKKGAYRV